MATFIGLMSRCKTYPFSKHINVDAEIGGVFILAWAATSCLAMCRRVLPPLLEFAGWLAFVGATYLDEGSLASAVGR
jgi:hypothetical protein